MKRLCVIIYFVCLAISSVHAQKGAQIGLKVFPQYLKVFNSEDAKDPDFNAQLTIKAGFGGTFDYHFHENIGAGLELLYSMQGQNYKDEFGFAFRYNVNYLKIPLVVNVNTNPAKVVMFYAQAGPQFSFVTTSNRVTGNGKNKDVIDMRFLYNKFNFGAVLSLGAQFKLPRNFLFYAGVRLDGTFTDAISMHTVGDSGVLNPANALQDRIKLLLAFDEYSHRSPTYLMTTAFEVGFKYIINKKIKLVVY